MSDEEVTNEEKVEDIPVLDDIPGGDHSSVGVDV